MHTLHPAVAGLIEVCATSIDKRTTTTKKEITTFEKTQPPSLFNVTGAVHIKAAML